MKTPFEERTLASFREALNIRPDHLRITLNVKKLEAAFLTALAEQRKEVVNYLRKNVVSKDQKPLEAETLELTVDDLDALLTAAQEGKTAR